MISRTQKTLLLFPLAALLIPSVTSVASAETVVRSGEAVSVAEEQMIEGDFYAAAGKINISGSVEEDMVAAAGQITLNGTVGDNVFLFAGKTDIHGTVGDDLRIISGETTIAEPVMGDVLVLGGTVNILSTASVSGDVLLYAGTATIEGSVGGDVLGTIGNLRIDAAVAGNVDVTVDQVTLGDRAAIEGSVRYVSNELIVQSINATVGGDVVRSDPFLPGSQPNIQAAVIPLLILLFSVLVWYLISRRSLNAVIDRALVKSPRPFLLGFLVLFFAPVIFALLFISMIGTLVSFAVVLGYALLVVLSFIGVSAVFGQLLMAIFNQPSRHSSLLSLAVGVVGIGLLMLLPYIGQAVLLVLLLITLGAMVDLLHRPTVAK